MVKQIPSLKIKDYIKSGDILLDVRTSQEWNSIGRPDGESLGLKTFFVSYQLEQNGKRVPNPNLDKELRALNLDKSKQIFCICRSGARSDNVAKVLEAQGYNAINISDGFYVDETKPSWKKNGLPLQLK